MSSSLSIVSLLVVVGLQLFCHVQSVKDNNGKCPPSMLGSCLCRDRLKNSTDDHETGGFTNTSAFKPTTKDTCKSDEDCKNTEKCCKSGCCGYKSCISTVSSRPVKHYGVCPARAVGTCLCPERVQNSTGNHTHHHEDNETSVFTNTSAFKPNSNDTCRSDKDCTITQKCCKGGCCGYRSCVESVKDTADQCTRANEEYKRCGSLCYPTCENKARPIPCPMVCKGGCFCKKGYLRRIDGECVQQNDCKLTVNK